MSKKIGPSFYSELQAAGVQDWRFSWSCDDGVITFSSDMADDQQALVQSVYEAHDPTKQVGDPDPETTLTNALQEKMDATARSFNYDSLATAITYRGDPNPKFAAEAEAFFQWRSAVWTTAYAVLDDVKAGKRPFPTIDEAISMMPALNLPAE